MDRDSILNYIKDDKHSFEDKALAVFEYQYIHNLLYQRFVSLVRYNDFRPQNVSEIPHFPISLFKSNKVQSGVWKEDCIFRSSGTTLGARSQHFIRDADYYLKNAEFIWCHRFGELKDFTFLSLLPNYHENPSSSLLFMVNHFMLSGHGHKLSYFLDDFKGLRDQIDTLLAEGKQVVLFGVSFALLDYVKNYQHECSQGLFVVETGGMKKFRREMTRQELHDQLSLGFRGASIISEYGMTECLSQMYCTDHLYFEPNPRMALQIADPTDPSLMVGPNKRGRVCIIDLGNIDTISFIATDDLGLSDEHGNTQILGRLDNSDIRGCNYLI